jgi:hypothetical protein
LNQRLSPGNAYDLTNQSVISDFDLLAHEDFAGECGFDYRATDPSRLSNHSH